MVLRDQKGQIAIILALALVVVGALVVVPFLTLSMSAFRYTETVEQKVQEFYTCEAGVEYGLRYLLDHDAPTGTYIFPTAPEELEELNDLQMQITITTETVDASHTSYTITAYALRDGNLVEPGVEARGTRTGSSVGSYNITVEHWDPT